MPRCSRLSLSCVRVSIGFGRGQLTLSFLHDNGASVPCYRGNRHVLNRPLRAVVLFAAWPLYRLQKSGIQPHASSKSPWPRPPILPMSFKPSAPALKPSTHIHPVFSFGSTAQLARQIENSAPFDIFTAADATHVDQLDQKHLLLAGSRALYARGVLALWIPPGAKPRSRVLKTSSNQKFGSSPSRNPSSRPTARPVSRPSAPESLGPRPAKVVYAENINMAKAVRFVA